MPDEPTPPAGGAPVTPKLEDLLATLDETARGAVLGEVSKARKEAQGLRDRLKEAEPKATQYDALAAASKTEAERAADALKDREAKATAAVGRLAKAEVKAAATAKFADPDDAAAFVDSSKYVDADGNVDTAAINADLNELLVLKPHLAKTGRGPRPDPSQGAGTGTPPTKPADVFAAFVKNALGNQ